MSSKNNEFENDLLQLIFQNTVPAAGVLDTLGDGIVAATTPGSLYISLHTADPGEAGTQATSELTLGSYARIPVARSGAGWTVSTNNASNAVQVRFPASGTFTTGSETAYFFQIGTLISGAGHVVYSGHLGDTAFDFTAEADTDVLTIKGGHTFAVSDQVFVYDVPGQALPTGLTRGVYFILTVVGDDVTLSLTDLGAPVNFTVDGGGYIAELAPRALTVGDVLTFEIGDLDVFED